MENLKNIVASYFEFLSKEFGFVKSREKVSGESYEAEFRSEEFIIQLEKYRRELYVYVLKPGINEDQVNLFSLIEYLNNETGEKIGSNYYSDVADLNECFRLQASWIANAVKQYIHKIRLFFTGPEHRQKIVELRKYMIKKHPDLFPTGEMRKS